MKLPSINDQKKIIFEESIKEAIQILKNNLNAAVFLAQDEVDETLYPNTHLLREQEG
ncbi:hypothetical protein MNBD_GAMMA10-1287 [hydrothermal vent metagenome]|uniref:Uncharacterized protein n=1 Tax=hydrothermal vent metagenome TaxID=652676 RepID=A0A3B0YSI8_9ZZZZ